MLDINNVKVSELANGLELSDLIIRDANEINVFDKIEKITWLEFRVKNNGIRNLHYLESYLEYFGVEKQYMGHDEGHSSYQLNIGDAISMRIPIECPDKLQVAKLSLSAHRYSWPYKLAKKLDAIWVFLKY